MVLMSNFIDLISYYFLFFWTYLLFPSPDLVFSSHILASLKKNEPNFFPSQGLCTCRSPCLERFALDFTWLNYFIHVSVHMLSPQIDRPWPYLSYPHPFSFIYFTIFFTLFLCWFLLDRTYLYSYFSRFLSSTMRSMKAWRYYWCCCSCWCWCCCILRAQGNA